MFKFESDTPEDIDLSWERKYLVSCYQEIDSSDFIFPQTDSVPKTLRESIQREWNW